MSELRERILGLVSEYYIEAFAPRAFVPGVTPVPVAGRVFDGDELRSLVDASLDFWLTAGRFAEKFEREFARWIGIRECVLVNSGSSANLLALSALTSPKLGDRQLIPGDEVITVSMTFVATTVNPDFQNSCSLSVDVSRARRTTSTTQLDRGALVATKAIMLAHTLGNPFDLGAVTDLRGGTGWRG
jgi:CDP-6-deoxy-D-xylo-4-hexulose-3-dehydrase